MNCWNQTVSDVDGGQVGVVLAEVDEHRRDHLTEEEEES